MKKPKFSVARLMHKAVAAKIYQTTDYDAFTLSLQNRPIDPARVQEFEKKFKNGQFFLEDMPGLVDDEGVIIDAQHRFTACKNLKLPFFYKIASECTINNVVDIQTNAGWSTNDYLDKYVAQNMQDYVILKRFTNRYKLGVSTSILMLSGDKALSGLKTSGFKEGLFKVKNESQAHIWAKAIEEMEVPFYRESSFVRAMIRVMNVKGYDHKRMKSKVKAFPSILVKQIDVEAYLDILDKLYNRQCIEKHRLRLN